MWNSDNPYLSGNYAPWREEGDAYDLEVEGEIPHELSGALYRIGPNPQFKPAGRYHWFDGDGMVHGFLLRDGRAAYRNRYVKTEGLKAEMKYGRALYGGLIDGMMREVPADVPPMKNQANTNIIGYANRLLALMEGGLPTELKPETLETVGMYSFGGKVNGPVTAHPKYDPKNGDLLFFGYSPFPPYTTWYRADKAGNLLETRAIDSGLPVMMHDFVTTDNYAIFFVCPSVFRIENASKGLPVMAWEPQHGTRIGAMHRKSGEIKWFHTDAFYVFHFLNAYEENGSLVIDGCRLNSLNMGGNSFGDPAMPWQWTLNLKDGSMRDRQIDDTSSEFPRLDERRAGLKHRYGYFAGGTDKKDRALGFTSVIKRDYQTGKHELQTLGGNKTPGEPVFVPRSASSGEDEGWVLSVWYDRAENTSEMVIQNAQDFGGTAVARVKAPHRVPFGFHGNWVPA
ncbi:MAG: carotenoid oxygenase family protein [Candidatus Binataceae bacterium]